MLATLGGDDVVEVVVLLRRSDRDDSLMRHVPGHAVELRALDKAHRHVQPPAVFNQPLQANVVALLRHPDPLKRPPASLQGLANGTDAIDVMHELSVYRK